MIMKERERKAQSERREGSQKMDELSLILFIIVILSHFPIFMRSHSFKLIVIFHTYYEQQQEAIKIK